MDCRRTYGSEYDQANTERARRNPQTMNMRCVASHLDSNRLLSYALQMIQDGDKIHRRACRSKTHRQMPWKEAQALRYLLREM